MIRGEKPGGGPRPGEKGGGRGDENFRGIISSGTNVCFIFAEQSTRTFGIRQKLVIFVALQDSH